MWRRMVSEISLSPLGKAMPRTPIEVRPWNTRTSVTGKRMHWPPAAVSSTSSRSADLHVDDRLVLVELHGNDAGTADVDEVRQLVAADVAAGGREHHVEIGP